jgi:hypothetical protein
VSRWMRLMLGERPGKEIRHCFLEAWGLLALRNSYFTLRQRRLVGRFDLTSGAGIALLRALLDVLPVEQEVIPVDLPALENRHASLYLSRLLKCVILAHIFSTHSFERFSLLVLPVSARGAAGGLVRTLRMKPVLTCTLANQR